VTNKKQTVEEFLASGGKIKVVPTGTSSLDFATPKNREETLDMFREGQYKRTRKKK
jgi:hypothetical protein